MKVKLTEIQASASVFKKLLDQQLDVKVAYWLNKDTKAMQKHLVTIETFRNSLFKKFGEPDPQNVDRSRIKPENMQLFYKEMNDFLAQEVDIDMKPLDISKLRMPFSASELDLLEKFIVVPEDWDKKEEEKEVKPKKVKAVAVPA